MNDLINSINIDIAFTFLSILGAIGFIFVLIVLIGIQNNTEEVNEIQEK